MSKLKTYKNAPIIEALIDFQIIPCDEFSDSFYDTIQKHPLTQVFSSKSDLQEITAQFSIEPTSNTFQNSRKKIGIRLETPDKNFVLQVKERGFTFSILNSYTDWEDFQAQAKKFWTLYCEIFRPKEITREAVRYINRIDIPMGSPILKIEDYFNVYPRIFDGNDVELSGFLMQVQIPQKEQGGLAILTQSIVPPKKPLNLSFILDIDVFDVKQFDPDSDRLWERLEMLRQQKNQIFESAIKDSVREIIQ